MDKTKFSPNNLAPSAFANFKLQNTCKKSEKSNVPRKSFKQADAQIYRQIDGLTIDVHCKLHCHLILVAFPTDAQHFERY